MKARTCFVLVFAVLVPVVTLALLVTLVVAAQRPQPGTLPHNDLPSTLPPAPTMPIAGQGSQKYPRRDQQTILLWPRKLSEFMSEYSSWGAWLGSRRPSPYAVRDELLVSVRALATIIPYLEVGTDDLSSDIIIVSGNPASVSALLDRLRDHPLLAGVIEDSPARRDEARTAWTKSRFDRDHDTPYDPTAPVVNIRNNWGTNVVWGYSAPGATIHVTLTRSSGHVLTTTATTNLEGLYHAYLAWEIRDGDVIDVDDGAGRKKVPITPLGVSVEISTASITGVVLPAPEATGKTFATPRSLEVTVGKTSQTVTVNSAGAFAAEFGDEPFRPGTRGFLRYTDADGNRIFMPFSVPIVNVRRDTSFGLPYGSAHSAGISAIVWGSATPSAALAITLTRAGNLVVTRTVTADQVGNFSVSVDRLIEDGDIVEVFDGADVRTVPVPTMTFHADPVTRMIAGTAPAGIATTVPGAPHSFQISIGGNTRQVTTTATGEFSAGFTANPYLAGLLGALRYTTPDGDRVYKPLFVADPLVRGKLGDWRADIILGQPDFSQITYNEVVGNKLFNPGGVYVDRSAQPNRVYVYDGGNSRVLGLSHLGACLAGANAGQVCTTQSDCPGSSCQIQEERAADIVFGQPSFNSSACNADSGYQIYPDVLMASAATLCGMREEQMSTTEGGSQAAMAADAQGNLYVPDYFNNRLLRYNSPFTTDTMADYVWGQSDFSGTTCNRGAGFYLHSDARSLCLASVPGTGPNVAGVAIDTTGNLWVADTMNNRVLRFPFDPALSMPTKEADLVLGQPDFSTITPGTGLNQLDKPTSVRVDSNGVVYVADSRNNRVLGFEPPLSSGMLASYQIGSGLIEPTGLEIDPTGGLWVNDSGNRRFIYFVNGVMQKTVNSEGRIWGGLGVDRDGNVMATGHDSQQGLHYAAPTYTLKTVFLRSEFGGSFNQTSARSAYGGLGLEVAAGQLIYGGGSRILFWNNPWKLTNYQEADGVVGEPDFQTQHNRPVFQRMRVDGQRRLWVIHGDLGQVRIHNYKLPLKTGATPVLTVTSPLPLQGGGVFTWTVAVLQGGIDVQSTCDCLWLSDQYNHRVFRIRNVSTQPVVDVVLGQLNVSGTQCNQGRGRDFPSRGSFCDPGALAFDKAGNLWVADHNLEATGNLRLLEFDASTIPDAPTSAVFGIPATRVLGRNGSFTAPNCLYYTQDPMCGPWEPAFDSGGRMVIGFNGYLGPHFPMVYQHPLTNPMPITALGDFHSMPLSARFDQFDNLYILDGNRSRILIYRDREVQTYAVTGAIKTASGEPIPGVQVETIGYASSGISGASGAYTLTGVVTGTYELIPSKNHYTFTPITRTVNVPEVTVNQDFVGYYIPTTATITAPLSGATVSELVTVTVEGTGDRVELYLDNVLHGKASGLPVSWSWSTRQVANGLHTLRAIPYDDEDRIGVSHLVTVTVSNPPTTTLWLLAGLSGLTVTDLAVAPSDRQILYAATETDGVYKTIDGGMFWTAVNNGLPPNANFSSIAISPNTSQVIYVGSTSGSVYKTTNAGDSWWLVGLSSPIWDLAIARSDEQTVYAVGYSVYRTMNGGTSWTLVLTNLWSRSVAIDPLDARTVYVGGAEWDLPWVIYKTINGGSSWVTRTVESLSGEIAAVVIDPHETQTLYVGKVWGAVGLFISTDGALSWVRINLPFSIQSLALAPSDSNVLYASGQWGSVYQSRDGGTTWDDMSSGLPGETARALTVDLLDPAVVYAGLNNGGVWKYVPPACYDFDGDKQVGIADIQAIASRWRLTAADPDPDNDPISPNYELRFDLDRDGDIDIVDIMKVSAHWGELCD